MICYFHQRCKSVLVKRRRSVGIMLAPGRRDDHAMNSYVENTCIPVIEKELHVRVHKQHPTATFKDIQKCMGRFTKKNCNLIFVIGQQCKTYISHLVTDRKWTHDTRFVFIDNPSTNFDVGDVRVTFDAIDLEECATGAALGTCLGHFVRDKPNIRIAFIGGADVPVIKEYLHGFRKTITKFPVVLNAFYIGNKYSDFDNPAAGYELTKYVIEAYKPDVFVQVMGASCLGFFECLRNKLVAPKIVCAFDNSIWSKNVVGDTNIIFVALRNIEVGIKEYLRIYLNGHKENWPVSEEHKKGTIIQDLKCIKNGFSVDNCGTELPESVKTERKALVQ